jgi:SAM-dependent methyltransferase
MQIHKLLACPGCGGTEATPIRLGDRHELRSCSTCHLVFAPEYGDPDEIYVEGYLTGGTDFGLDVLHPLFQEFLAFAAGKRMERIERARPARGRFLDVGCGSGEVLAVARDRGWDAVGAEPVEQSAELARQRGLDVRTGLVQDVDIDERAWDVVAAFHVLEHITDGVAFLQLLARYARPGGLVVIEVPNFGGYERERKGADWPAVRALEHVAHYEPATLRSTMERAGLEPVQVGTLGFLWERQTLSEQLADLARPGWSRPLHRLSHRTDRFGEDVEVPGALARRMLLAVQALYDRRGRGQTVFGIARVAGGS